MTKPREHVIINYAPDARRLRIPKKYLENGKLGVDFIRGRCYINNITCVRGHCRRNGRGREKRKRATGWPNSDLGTSKKYPTKTMT